MKYTNKHIKEEYKFNQMWRTIGMILLLIGIFLVAFGLIQTKRKMDCVRPFEQVLQEEANPANQTAYIDIIQVPEKLAENKYEGYYLVTTAEESYIVGSAPPMRKRSNIVYVQFTSPGANIFSIANSLRKRSVV